MSANHDVLEIPKRITLSAQTAQAIARGIERATWTGYLPSERRLCELFQVSRPTIRAALQKLAKDGWFDIRQGCRKKLAAGKVGLAANNKRLVCLIIGESVSHMHQFAYQGITEMRAHLAEHGFPTEILVCQSRTLRSQSRKIETFLNRNAAMCCVAQSLSKELQLWFAQKSIPVLVLGSCHIPGQLPCIDVDYKAVCRHAVGVFLRKGHRQIALVVPDSGLAGDIASEQGFLEGMEQQNEESTAHGIIVRHSGTPKNLTTRLDRLFNSGTPPTALLVAKQVHVFGVIIYLLKRGLSVPGKVSLIARDQDYIFESVDPPVSHYQFEANAYAHRLSRLMLRLVSGGELSREPNLMVPEFFEGGTVR